MGLVVLEVGGGKREVGRRFGWEGGGGEGIRGMRPVGGKRFVS